MIDANRACGWLQATAVPPRCPRRAQIAARSGDPRRMWTTLAAFRAPSAPKPNTRRLRRAGGHNDRVDLARVAWLSTVLACLVAAAILLLQGYSGYGGVCVAVAVSAAVNLK